ncbi:unnamed protein product [Rotaria sp. Silwood2]|nr:unnamed protein product [Rotaria sp. Silwood2]
MQQQQQEQEQQHQQQTSSSTNQPNLHQHSSTSGYPSVRHSLLRMHSQLRSAPNGRESTHGPIDLSLYRVPRPAPKMAARSTSTATTALRTVTPLVTPPTHTIYSNAVPSFTSSKTATSINNQEQNIKMQNSCSTSVMSKCSYSS